MRFQDVTFPGGRASNLVSAENASEPIHLVDNARVGRGALMPLLEFLGAEFENSYKDG
jgi:hypothetical protein